MILFIDESGIDHRDSPHEVLAGVIISEDKLWDLVCELSEIEKSHFGDLWRTITRKEKKGTNLLKPQIFKWAHQEEPIAQEERKKLARLFLIKNQRNQSPRRREFAAYGQACISFVREVLNISITEYGLKIIASILPRDITIPNNDLLRKDYVYFLERFYYFLERLRKDEHGLIIFDELERSKAHILIEQIERYFTKTQKGQDRCKRIVPVPFFVHSDLTTGVFLADLVAYCLNWGWKDKGARTPPRPEIGEFVQKILNMRFQRTITTDKGEVVKVHSIFFMDKLT